MPDKSDHRQYRRGRAPSFCGSYMSAQACSHGTHVQELPKSDSANAEHDSDADESDRDMDTSFFDVRALQKKDFTTEQDGVAAMCEELAKSLRRRPTLPADAEDPSKSWQNLESGIAIPNHSCAFARCTWHGDTEAALQEHLRTDHKACFRQVCGEDSEEFWFDFYKGAITTIERNGVPAVGLSKDRQILRKLKETYNDENICQLICAVCAQSKTKTPCANSHIECVGPGWFTSLPKASKTLDANCGWDEWCRRYGSRPPLSTYGPGRCDGVPQMDWCLELDLCPAAPMYFRAPLANVRRATGIGVWNRR